MIDSELLKILCCPETRQPVTPADEKMVAKLNDMIASGQLKNRAGQPVELRIDGALMRSDGCYLYLIRDDIPVMLVDEAIAVPVT
jgi:uncharacterized protein YbaR (Trm112 family)